MHAVYEIAEGKRTVCSSDRIFEDLKTGHVAQHLTRSPHGDLVEAGDRGETAQTNDVIKVEMCQDYVQPACASEEVGSLDKPCDAGTGVQQQPLLLADQQRGIGRTSIGRRPTACPEQDGAMFSHRIHEVSRSVYAQPRPASTPRSPASFAAATFSAPSRFIVPWTTVAARAAANAIVAQPEPSESQSDASARWSVDKPDSQLGASKRHWADRVLAERLVH